MFFGIEIFVFFGFLHLYVRVRACVKQTETVYTKFLLFFYEHNLCKLANFVEFCQFVQIVLFLLQKILTIFQKGAGLLQRGKL